MIKRWRTPALLWLFALAVVVELVVDPRCHDAVWAIQAAISESQLRTPSLLAP